MSMLCPGRMCPLAPLKVPGMRIYPFKVSLRNRDVWEVSLPAPVPARLVLIDVSFPIFY